MAITIIECEQIKGIGSVETCKTLVEIISAY